MMPSKQVSADLIFVKQFRDDFEQLVDIVRAVQRDSNIQRAEEILTGMGEDGVSRCLAQAAHSAGRAGLAEKHAGYRWEQFGEAYSPIVNWRKSFDQRRGDIETVVTHTNQLLGYLERQLKETEDRESGLAGWMARFVRFPTDVREAAGLSSRGGQTAAFVVAVASQVVASLVLLGILALLGVGAAQLLQ